MGSRSCGTTPCRSRRTRRWSRTSTGTAHQKSSSAGVTESSTHSASVAPNSGRVPLPGSSSSRCPSPTETCAGMASMRSSRGTDPRGSRRRRHARDPLREHRGDLLRPLGQRVAPVVSQPGNGPERDARDRRSGQEWHARHRLHEVVLRHAVAVPQISTPRSVSQRRIGAKPNASGGHIPPSNNPSDVKWPGNMVARSRCSQRSRTNSSTQDSALERRKAQT